MAFPFGHGQRLCAPEQGLVHGALHRIADLRGMAGFAAEPDHRRGDAAMRQHRLAAGRFGHDDIAEAVIACQERRDAARVIGLFVAAEQESGVAGRRFGGGQQAGSRALDVAGAQADGAAALDRQFVRVPAPARRRRHRVQMHVEQRARIAAHGQQRHRAGAVVGHRAGETRQVGAQVIEDAAGAGGARRIAGVERDQMPQVLERPRQQGLAHARSPLTLAQRFELMPNSWMKPSASAAPQFADCA